jgi:hypothetical protein
MSLTMGIETYFEVQNLMETTREGEDPYIFYTQEVKNGVDGTEADNPFDFSQNPFTQGMQKNTTSSRTQTEEPDDMSIGL